MKRMMRLRMISAVAIIGCVGLAACSSSKPTSSSGGGGGAKPTSEAVKAAQANVDAFTAPLDKLTSTEPLAKLPKGTKVAFIVNDLAVTHAFETALKQAAPLLGLDVAYINGGQSTDTASRAWDQAVAMDPSVVVETGWPRAIFERQLKDLTAKGGKVVVDAIGEDGMTPPGIAANAYTPADATRMGQVLADYGVTVTGGAPNVLVPYVPDFLVSRATKDGIKARIKERCPGCEVQELAIKPTDLGTKAPQEIVSALQRNPKVNFLAPTWDAIYTGVPTAMKQAGLGHQVKVATTGGGPAIFNDILKGDADAVLARPNYWYAWQLADTVARVATGQKVSAPPTFDGFNFPIQLLTKATITFDPNSEWEGWSGFRDAYKKVWGVS